MYAIVISPPESDSLRSRLSFTPDVFLVRPKTIVFRRICVLRVMFFFFQREISEMRGPTGVKFCTVVSTGPNFIMLVQNFGALPTLPPGWTGSYTCPALRPYQLGPMRVPECNQKVTGSGHKAVTAMKPQINGCKAVNRRL